MPLASTRVPQFLASHPTFDGRGVLIAILDSGVDPGAPGLIATSTGVPKLLDVRDFSSEGTIALSPVSPDPDGHVTVAGHTLTGAGRVHRLAVGPVWYGGVFRELALGAAPAADVNGNGTNTDEFPLVVVKATDGWAAFIDTNLNKSLDDETPLHDYRQGRETLSLGTHPLTLAANFADSAGRPSLALYFDTSGHGTHVAGIAAGHNLYNVAGFNGVAPGAQLLGLKIANDARGGLTTHGSVVRAMNYAAQFAAERSLPLILNLSFGIGNEREGQAVIDSIVEAFIVAHPAVVFVVSAGNDGPGVSTMGLPASADLALTVGATFPGPFTKPLAFGERPPDDRLGWWSSRGGELGKPDIVAPGIAYSSVPRWNTGDEVKGGTSMAAPYVSGLAACLLSAMAQQRWPVRGVDIAGALAASAIPFPGASPLGEGAGQPQLPAAYEWLVAGHQGSHYVVRAASGTSAAWRPNGLAGPADTVETFRVTHAAGRRAAQFVLRTDVPWLRVPALISASPGATTITVRYRADALKGPGLHVGTVTAFNPSDTLAGPIFRLVNAIAVPHALDAESLIDTARTVPAAQVQRYFLRAPAEDATLTADITLRDSVAHTAIVRLYEPGGRPFRGAEEVDLGDDDPGTAHIVVRAEDFLPGVYELTVVGPPLDPVTVDVRAALSEVAMAFERHGVTITNRTRRPLEGVLKTDLVGAERVFTVAGRAAAESLAVPVPPWADSAEIDFALPLERWQNFTDFGLTVFDAGGQIVKKTPLNYALARQRFSVADLQGSIITAELFPAYAWPDRAPAWHAQIRVRFLAKEAQHQNEPRSVSLTAGESMHVPLTVSPGLPLPEAFAPLVRVWLGHAVARGPVEGGP